ncbi:hypothetical protein [Clostridium sp. AM58-1XD]|nr:hypothetical protein [Clostridium sp. AM58-1XD]
MDSVPHMIGHAHVLTECRSPNPPGDGKDIAMARGIPATENLKETEW